MSDGRVVRLDDGTLAGSAAGMDDLVRLMASLHGMTAARAVEMAANVPARVLGEGRLGRIREGACSDLVVLDRDPWDDLDAQVVATMLAGRWVHNPPPWD